ncbi:YqaJ viral recombinase family protein [Gilvimarinus chinensis]|uniref:YqaJ viral recombinase family protein n=1 Tax=Gilvimarinus chinensis TaxID=396005 RepID=UPI0003626C4B|nr:YqaJ viral recombinase family protein [Gilvimarinus chinensis]
MKTLENLVQGSPEWKKIRGEFCVASEAPIIMGASPNVSRDELLRLKATGDEQVHDEWVEKFVFAKGHEVEALARPFAEKAIGEELYPVTATEEVAGLKLLASYDGLTMFEDNHWECKQHNQALHALVSSGGELEGKHYWQLEHQLLVNGNDSCVFEVTDGTEEGAARLVYKSRPERREQLIEGWKIFIQDLENYQPVEATVQLEGKTPENLPALIVEITGGVKTTNLPTYKEHALAVLDAISTDLNTDQDFADAATTVKWCEGVEKKLELTKEQALSQTADIDQLMRTIDELKEATRQKRLNLNRQVESRKKEIRTEIATTARNAWASYVNEVNAKLSPCRLPEIACDVAGAMKGKRTIDTLRGAANDEVMRAKVEANRFANTIEANLNLLADLAEGYDFLFADKQELCLKDSEALAAIAKQRIADHKAEEERKAEAERQRIREEERQRAEKEAAEKAQAERDEANRIALECAEQSAVVRQPAPDMRDDNQDQAASVPRDVNELMGTTQKPAAPYRPSDDEIIHLIAEHYSVSINTAEHWIKQMQIRVAA